MAPTNYAEGIYSSTVSIKIHLRDLVDVHVKSMRRKMCSNAEAEEVSLRPTPPSPPNPTDGKLLLKKHPINNNIWAVLDFILQLTCTIFQITFSSILDVVFCTSVCGYA